MRPSAPLLAVLLATLLAGCTVEAPRLEGTPPGLPSGPPNPAGVPPAQLPDQNLTPEQVVMPVPEWAPRHAWRWGIVDNQGGPGGTQHLVVLRDLGADWLVGTADRAEAIATAFEGRSNYGRVQKSALSGYDAGQPTRFFDFPLQQNKTWTMQLRFSGPIPVQATYLRDVDGKGPGFLVEGRSGAGAMVSYTYAPAVKWMTRFSLGNETGPSFTRTLNAYTTNYTGPWYFATARDLYAEARSGAQTAGALDSFDQSGPFDQLHLRLVATGQGAADLRLVDSVGQLRFNFTATGPQRVEAELPSVPGTWQVLWNVAGDMEVALRVAGMEVEEGSF